MIPEGEGEELDLLVVSVGPGILHSAAPTGPEIVGKVVHSDSELFSITVMIRNEYWLEVAFDNLQFWFLVASEEVVGAGLSVGA